MFAKRFVAAAMAAFVILPVLALTSLPAAAAELEPGLGVYRGAGAPEKVEEFGTWLGRSPTYALDYFPATTWETITNPAWTLRSWADSPYEVVYSVPLLPDTGGSITLGAVGAYDAHFVTLATVMVAHGQGDAILRPGWEFNGGWYSWTAQTDPAAFAAYWRHVVDAMRSVPGADFRFDWSVSLGTNQFPLEQAYPGDAYVDVISADVYDASWYVEDHGDPVRRWQRMLTQPHGLDWFKAFANAHGKPKAFAEWGLNERSDGNGGGDNPYFIERMHDWITSNDVLYHMYFDFDVSAELRYGITGDNFPKAALRYQELFGPVAEIVPTVPLPTTEPLTCLSGTTLDGGFRDIAGNVHEQAISCITASGITQGGPSGMDADQYGPGLDVQRDQMASFIARTIDRAAPGALPAAPPGNRFGCDVSSGNVHFDAIQRLAAAGVVMGGPGGISADCYGPNSVVRRDQMTSFLNRAIEQVTGSALTSESNFFADTGDSVHKLNINALAAHGIVAGTGSTSYNPLGSVHRDQMASFTARTLDLLVAAAPA